MSVTDIDFDGVFDAAPSAMLIVSPALQILSVNLAYAAATGRAPVDLIGRHMFDAFPDNPDDPSATGVSNLRRSYENVLATRSRDVMPLQKYDIPSGAGFEQRWWSPVNQPVLDNDGNVALIIHRVEDVTELVQYRAASSGGDVELEARLFAAETDLAVRGRELHDANQRLARARDELEVRSEALEAAQAAKDRFIATLCHELRNPLAAIQAAVEVLALDAPGATLAVIDRQARALVRMTDDLLDVSRSLSGKMRLDRSPFDLRDVVEDVIEDRPAMLDRHVIIEVPDDEVAVDGDPIRLAQLLANLVDNAEKFTIPGDTIRIELTTTDDRATLAVIDTGIGFERGSGPRLFDTFVQLDSSLDRTAGGLGLGLAIVRSIAELHGGTVHAHSDGPGTGACLTVSLPLANADAPRPTPPARPVAPAALRILLIDDNEDLTSSMRDILTRSGHRVDAVTTGRDGIAVASAGSYDVIVCDIGLPDIDGYAVAEAITSSATSNAPTLIALTGYAHHPPPQDADPFTITLRKPTTAHDLLAVIDQMAQ